MNLGTDVLPSLSGWPWSSCTATRTTTTRSSSENLEASLVFGSSWLTWPFCAVGAQIVFTCGPTQSTWRLKEPDVCLWWTNGLFYKELFNSNQNWAPLPRNSEVMPFLLPVRRFMGLYCLNRTIMVRSTESSVLKWGVINAFFVSLFLIVLGLVVGINCFFPFDAIWSHSYEANGEKNLNRVQKTSFTSALLPQTKRNTGLLLIILSLCAAFDKFKAWESDS